MTHLITDDKVEGFSRFRCDADHVDVKRGSDRFRNGYHEICLKGYNSRSMEDLAETLQEDGYRLMKGDRFSLTYGAPDGRTRINLEEESDVRSEYRMMTILRGGLTEDELPVAEQEVISFFYDFE